jgi:hypothetical protein
VAADGLTARCNRRPAAPSAAERASRSAAEIARVAKVNGGYKLGRLAGDKLGDSA